MFGALDISTSGMLAQRLRLNVISANLANQFSTMDADGNAAPFRRRIPVFAPGDPATGNDLGVHVREVMLDQSPFRQVYEPNHPAANAEGYVNYPNVDPMVEMINAIEASRAYEANITAAEASKSMVSQALRLLA